MPTKTRKAKITTKIKKQLNKLAKYLDEAKVKYDLLEHKVVYTAHDLAATTKRNINAIAKVVLVKSEKGLALVIVPAGKYVDFKAVQKALKVKKISIAKESDIAKYLKTKIGLLHPFGNLYKIPTLIDKGFSKARKFVAAAGTYTESVEVALNDFEKLAQPIKGVFGKSKK
ncbi:MAG: YbaK/EbsC family protein [Patescibacteria group bacterium]|nr:YbaK/EbsC family protein [Patescibacteria group bacterium]